MSDLSNAEREEWLIRKGGYFYRPNCQGYTTIKAEAGRYTKAKAEAEAAVESWHMKAVHQDEVAPDSLSARLEFAERQLAQCQAELAASRLQAPAVAEVEPLEWNEYERGDDGPEEWDAETKFGTFYQIDIGMNGFRWRHDLEGGGNDLDSLDDAKAAAQADYAARIRSTLRTGGSE